MPLFFKPPKRHVVEIPPGDIRPNPNQPRKTFSPQALEDLASSIAQVGILQPLSVRRTPEGWELVAGERRLRAAELAGLPTVPCLPVEADVRTSTLLALVENVQRENLDIWEEAAALQALIAQCSLSQEEAARQVGKSQSAVANKLRLLKLPPDVIEELRTAQLTERHARALLRLDCADLQRKAARHIIRHQLNVAQSEEYIQHLTAAPPPKRAVPIYKVRDVRLFLNTIQKSLAAMQSAGVHAQCGREETDHDITLTIHISK